MNAKVYYWGGVGSAFLIGVATGIFGVRTDLERKLRKEYTEREEMLQGAYAKALDLQRAEGPVQDEADLGLDENLDRAIEGLEKVLDHVDSGLESGILTEGGNIETVSVTDHIGQVIKEVPVTDNPYHKAVQATETPHQMFVDGGINDYGISYIEEEDYLDEDGRFKGKIDILFDDQTPMFIMDGQQIEDWDKRLGDSILVDFFKLVPPGVAPILYVRNHKTDEDYEVVRVEP